MKYCVKCLTGSETRVASDLGRAMMGKLGAVTDSRIDEGRSEKPEARAQSGTDKSKARSQKPKRPDEDRRRQKREARGESAERDG